MKAKLQRHLHKVFGSQQPYALNNINQIYSIGGKIHIRFELGGELNNGTKVRVEQATQRAVMLFEETFENREEEIWILAYDYPGKNLFGKTKNFFQRQFSVAVYAGFYNEVEPVLWHNGQLVKTKVLIGKAKAKNLKYESIINAIANAEMGFEPKISERIFFVGTQTNKIFYMYDDRGCLVESNNADSIRDLYLTRSSWIVDYHRAEIDKQF